MNTPRKNHWVAIEAVCLAICTSAIFMVIIHLIYVGMFRADGEQISIFALKTLFLIAAAAGAVFYIRPSDSSYL